MSLFFQAKLETKALKAKRPGFTDDRYNETSYYVENGSILMFQDDKLLWIFIVSGLRKVYPYYFTFTTFTKGRWVGEKILDVFAREFRAHPVEEYVSLQIKCLFYKSVHFHNKASYFSRRKVDCILFSTKSASFVVKSSIKLIESDKEFHKILF